jgi:hypothetical protein
MNYELIFNILYLILLWLVTTRWVAYRVALAVA